MTTREKTGCVFGLLSIFISLPLGWVYSYLLLTHVEASPTLWMLFWINIPISLTLSIGFKLMENFIKDEQVKS